ncbi:MAG: alginate lyase family protein, partial [Betaproteobacteria bacterium]
PGDWARILANAKSMAATGEAGLTASTPTSTFGSHGTLARDAAFYQLVTADGTMLNPVRNFLLAQAGNAALDFSTTLCITSTSGATGDAYFYPASWLLRYVVTYDYVRNAMSSADRLTIENFIRRNAHFLAAHNDALLARNFPSRMVGDYSKISTSAAPPTDAATWWSKRYDTNGDCIIDGNDAASAYPVYAYVTATGVIGPRISVLSQWYNNRRSVATAAYGAAGVLLGDADLIASAKRYFMEWLAYSVWPDGSQGEYARNGDYCIAPQGLIYSASNLQGATGLARLLARQGDNTLINFTTTAGLFGSQGTGSTTITAKSIELVAGTHIKLLTGQLNWYYQEPWRTTQNISASGSLGNNQVRYLGSIKVMDDYHELGLLPAAALLPRLPIAGLVLRDKAVTSLPFPGATGNNVATGYGNWTDAFNALSAVLLLRP